MSDLRFDNNPDEFGRPPSVNQGTDMAARLVNWGIVANREQATYVLVGVGVLALIIAFFLIRGGGSDLPPPPPIGV